MLRNEKGFSLLELVTVVGISSMITYSIFIAMSTSNVQTQTSDLKMLIQDSAREGLYKMAQEIRQSAPARVSVTTPAAGYDVIEFDIPNPNSPVNTDNSDAVEDYSTDWTTALKIQYARGGANCTRIVRTYCSGGACPESNCPNAGTDTLTSDQKVIANDVQSLSFDNTTLTNTVIINMGTQRTLYANGQRNLMVDSSGQSAPLVMTAKAEMRNT